MPEHLKEELISYFVEFIDITVQLKPKDESGHVIDNNLSFDEEQALVRRRNEFAFKILLFCLRYNIYFSF